MLEELRQLLSNPQSSIIFALVAEVDTPEPDHAIVTLKAIPEGHDIVARMSFASPAVDLPEPLDIAVVLLVGDSIDNATIISFMPRLQTNRVIHQRVINGETVVSSRTGKKLNLASDTRVNIGKGGEDEEAEPLVLGVQLKTLLNNLMSQVATLATEVNKIALESKKAMDNIVSGPVTLPGSSAGPISVALGPKLTASGLIFDGSATASKAVQEAINKDSTSLIGKYITDEATNILSQIAFTERGAPE